MRTDEHNNPTAFTTDIAFYAGLVKGEDYETGAPFSVGSATFYTAKILKDPIQTTIKVIDKIGFVTKIGGPRWIYINLPKWLWNGMNEFEKTKVIGFMYHHEGGVSMVNLFPPYEG